MKHFAYGANLNHKLMERRCPGGKFLKRCYLDGYRLVYDGYEEGRRGAVANIVSDKKSRVWGGIYEVSGKDLEYLDVCEGCAKNVYRRREVRVKDDRGNIYKAQVYFRTGQAKGKPHKNYRNIILEGVRDCCLPEDYGKSLMEIK